MNTVAVLVTDVGIFPVPPHMAEIASQCRFRRDGWPDMRFKMARAWVDAFRAFSDQKLKEYMANA